MHKKTNDQHMAASVLCVDVFQYLMGTFITQIFISSPYIEQMAYVSIPAELDCECPQCTEASFRCVACARKKGKGASHVGCCCWMVTRVECSVGTAGAEEH
jgi:hypothetical protein